MRRFVWRDGSSELVADLGDDGTWTCDDPVTLLLLTTATDGIFPPLSAADGEPLAAMFHQVAKLVNPDEAIYDAPVGKTPDDITP